MVTFIPKWICGEFSSKEIYDDIYVKNGSAVNLVIKRFMMTFILKTDLL